MEFGVPALLVLAVPAPCRIPRVLRRKWGRSDPLCIQLLLVSGLSQPDTRFTARDASNSAPAMASRENGVPLHTRRCHVSRQRWAHRGWISTEKWDEKIIHGDVVQLVLCSHPATPSRARILPDGLGDGVRGEASRNICLFHFPQPYIQVWLSGRPSSPFSGTPGVPV